MSYMKALAIECEEAFRMTNGYDPTHEELAAMVDRRLKEKAKKKLKDRKQTKPTTKSKESDPVPMSVKRLFDNDDAWLDDEPWRKW